MTSLSRGSTSRLDAVRYVLLRIMAPILLGTAIGAAFIEHNAPLAAASALVAGLIFGIRLGEWAR